MLSAILRVQLREPLHESIDGFKRWKYVGGKPTLVDILTATVIEGMDSATMAQHLALNDGTLVLCLKIMEAVRIFVRVSRGWSVA